MYHLPYFEKFYQTVHVPGHIVLMVGYCDQEEVVYVHDNSKAEVQTIPYQELMLAWREGYSAGQARKNALFAIQFHTQVPNVPGIVYNGLKKRAECVLTPPVKILGIPGIRGLSADFGKWGNVLESSAYTEALKHFVMFTASVVPALPSQLAEFDTGIPDSHQGTRDAFAESLLQNLSEYGNTSWEKAADLLRKSGDLIGQMTGVITEYLLNHHYDLQEIPELLKQVADYEEEAFRIFLS
jgi:hypothetical protein